MGVVQLSEFPSLIDFPNIYRSLVMLRCFDTNFLHETEVICNGKKIYLMKWDNRGVTCVTYAFFYEPAFYGKSGLYRSSVLIKTNFNVSMVAQNQDILNFPRLENVPCRLSTNPIRIVQFIHWIVIWDCNFVSIFWKGSLSQHYENKRHTRSRYSRGRSPSKDVWC